VSAYASPISVTFNDHGMFEHIIDDEIFLGVVGMLECKPHIRY
jgi:hypothetical protein